MGNKISLAGDLGSGKSTVAKLLIEALGAEYYSTGAIVRAVAEKQCGNLREHTARRANDLEIAISACLCRLEIAKIGKQVGGVLQDQQIAVVIEKVREIILILMRAYERRIHSTFEKLLAKRLKMCHSLLLSKTEPIG